MARSQRLRNADVRAVIRLVREVCELGEDARAWRMHMLRRLNGVIRACAGVSYYHPLPVDPRRLELRAYIDTGAGPEWDRYIREGQFEPDPTTPRMLGLLGKTVVRSRQQLCPDGEWYGSAYFNDIRRPLRMDESLVSLVVLPPHIGGFSMLGFGRTLGEPPFGRRERAAVHLFHTELVELWWTPPLGTNGTSATQAALPPRLRETLALLHEGLSEKQVALRVGLSPHTVHDYVKELHRRFSAATTTELVVRTRAARQFRPTLGME